MPASTRKSKTAHDIFKAVVVGGIQEDVRLNVPDIRVHGATEGARICLPAQEKNLARSSLRTFGGGGLNVATGLAKMGIASSLVAAVGDDSSGDRARSRLEANKVKPLLARKSNQTTGLSIILHTDETDAVLEDRGANDVLDFQDLSPIAQKKYSLLFISHLSGLSDRLLEDIVDYVSAELFVWNPGTTQLANGIRRYQKVLRARPVVIVNQSELFIWQKKKNPSLADYHDAARLVLRMGAQALAVTRGAQGVDLWANVGTDAGKNQLTLWHVPVVKTKVVDRLGGGDAFGSAFAAWFIRTENLCTAAIAGVNNAAATLAKTGATEGLLTWRELSTRVRAMTA